MNKAVEAYRRCEDGKAWKRAGGYVVLSYDRKSWGRIKVAVPADGAGPLHVFTWDCAGNGLQHGNASGYGYDKLGAAMNGLTWDGLTLGESWERQLRDAGYTVIQAI